MLIKKKVIWLTALALLGDAGSLFKAADLEQGHSISSGFAQAVQLNQQNQERTSSTAVLDQVFLEDEDDEFETDPSIDDLDDLDDLGDLDPNELLQHLSTIQ